MTKSVLLVFASLLTAIVASEVLLRLMDYNYSPLRIEFRGNVHDYRLYHAFEDRHFVYDPYLIWRPKGNSSVFNSQGYSGKELEKHKSLQEVRILALGDSNTLGWAGKDGPNWPRYLEELLRGSHKKAAVINAGVWGYSSLQGLRRFKETLSFQPDMVLVSFGANDAHKVAISDEEFVNSVLSGYQGFLYESKIGQLLIAVWHTLFALRHEPAEEGLVHRVSLRSYEENLSEIVELSRKHGLKCVLLTRPFIGESPNKLWWKNFAHGYVDATREVGKRYEVPVIDIQARFKDKGEYFEDESHFNEAGHRLAAKIIYDEVKPLLAPIRNSLR